MKRKVLRFIDFAAIMTLLIGASAADWSPIGIVMMLILVPCAYIGLRQWAEKERSLHERN
jgi:p-aminobenzoyl-glutamate transporter AbgT